MPTNPITLKDYLIWMETTAQEDPLFEHAMNAKSRPLYRHGELGDIIPEKPSSVEQRLYPAKGGLHFHGADTIENTGVYLRCVPEALFSILTQKSWVTESTPPDEKGRVYPLALHPYAYLGVYVSPQPDTFIRRPKEVIFDRWFEECSQKDSQFQFNIRFVPGYGNGPFPLPRQDPRFTNPNQDSPSDHYGWAIAYERNRIRLLSFKEKMHDLLKGLYEAKFPLLIIDKVWIEAIENLD